MRIGVDVGGTNVAIGLVDNNGTLIEKTSIKMDTTKDRDVLLQDIINEIRSLCEKNEVSPEKLELIGFGIPGAVHSETAKVIQCANIPWNNFELGAKVKEAFGVPVRADNDANVAAQAEFVSGSMKDKDHSVLVTIGTGIGGGIIVDGKMVRGKNGYGAELGHIIVGENFYNCGCGNNGCLETFCSATAIIKYAQKRLQEGAKSIIMDKCEGDLAQIDAKMVFDSNREGDELAKEVVDRTLLYLGIGIANVINLLDSDYIALGGGVAAGVEPLIPQLKEIINDRIVFNNIRDYEIGLATMGNDAGIIGAAMLDK